MPGYGGSPSVSILPKDIRVPRHTLELAGRLGQRRHPLGHRVLVLLEEEWLIQKRGDKVRSVLVHFDLFLSINPLRHQRESLARLPLSELCKTNNTTHYAPVICPILR